MLHFICQQQEKKVFCICYLTDRDLLYKYFTELLSEYVLGKSLDKKLSLDNFCFNFGLWGISPLLMVLLMYYKYQLSDIIELRAFN